MARPRVLCAFEPVPGADPLARLREVADVVVLDTPAQWTRENVACHLVDADAYICTLHVRIDRELLDAAKRLKIIYTPSTGLDHLDIPEIERRNIRLFTIKHERAFLDSITATAEMAFGLMLAAIRKIPAAGMAANRGEWARDRFRGHQISGKTLGILGVGRLGKMMVEYGRAFRMRVIGCERDASRERVTGCEYVDFDTLLRESDVITIHIHLTPENRHLVGPREFAAMKDGVVIVNTSRGGIIDETAMLAALESRKVGGAGLDVIDGEWRDDLIDHPFIRYAREHDNLVIAPHLGGVTYESQSAAIEFVAKKLAALIVNDEQP